MARHSFPINLPYWLALLILASRVGGLRSVLRGSAANVRSDCFEEATSSQHPQRFDPLAAKQDMEARQHSKTCREHKDASACKAQKLASGWECEWQLNEKQQAGPFAPAQGTCRAVTPCTRQWPTLFRGELPEMIIRGMAGTFDCATRMSHGCTGIKWLHCFMAMTLATCCWCCCCQPCWDADIPLPECPRPSECSLKDNCLARALKPKETGGVVNDCDSTDEYRDLGGFELEAALKRIVVRINWKDQGFGSRAGRLRARLIRSESVISEVDVFGLCGRKMDAYGQPVYDDPETVFTRDDEIVSRAQQGDSISFSYLVGAQDGSRHELHIKFFEADPEYDR